MKQYDLGVVPEYLLKMRLVDGSISFSRESEQKEYCAKAIFSAISEGVYPKYSCVQALRLILSARLPRSIRILKNKILKYLGIRREPSERQIV